MGENTEKYITFTVSIEKELTRINKDWEELKKNIFYILQFIDSARFIPNSLSDLGKILKEFIKINVNRDTMIKKLKLVVWWLFSWMHKF